MTAWLGCLVLLLLGLTVTAAAAPADPTPTPQPVKVEIRPENGGFRLYRAGQPYLIHGAVYGGDPAGKFPLRDLAACGGNSVRSGGDRRLLDAAHGLGMSVTVNLPMKMEAVTKFDYSDPQAVAAQFEAMKQRVLAAKDHPAVLMWSIGNELSERYTNKKVWDAVNDVARMIHAVDPNHPTLTVIGDGSIRAGDVQEIKRRCPDLDLLGVNYYGGLETVPAKLRAEGWEKPYVVTEWGPTGDWQVPRTKWGASIEESSSEKAQRSIERYQAVMVQDARRCVGSYAFIWGPRFERTHTWYGMHLETGERTDRVDALEYLWTGRWPAQRAPAVTDLRLDGQAARDSVYLPPGGTHIARVTASGGAELTYRWEIMAEVARGGYAGMGEKRAAPLADLLQATSPGTPATPGSLTFTAPAQAGAYRVFVFVVDGHGGAAAANFPFHVGPVPVATTAPRP